MELFFCTCKSFYLISSLWRSKRHIHFTTRLSKLPLRDPSPNKQTDNLLPRFFSTLLNCCEEYPGKAPPPPPFPFLLSPQFSRDQNLCSHATDGALGSHGNACYAGYRRGNKQPTFDISTYQHDSEAFRLKKQIFRIFFCLLIPTRDRIDKKENKIKYWRWQENIVAVFEFWGLFIADPFSSGFLLTHTKSTIVSPVSTWSNLLQVDFKCMQTVRAGFGELPWARKRNGRKGTQSGRFSRQIPTCTLIVVALSCRHTLGRVA